MGMDFRRNLEFYISTRDEELYEKITSVVSNLKNSIILLRDEYKDKEYFDSCLNVTDNSYIYNGMYSGIEKELVSGEWATRFNIFPHSPYSEMLLQQSPFEKDDFQKIVDLKLFPTEKSFHVRWKGQQKTFENIPENYKFIFDIDLEADKEYYTEYYKKILSLINNEFVTESY